MMVKNENVIFPEHFLNKNISLNIALRSIKFRVCILGIRMEGGVSHFPYVCPGFYFIKCRN